LASGQYSTLVGAAKTVLQLQTEAAAATGK